MATVSTAAFRFCRYSMAVLLWCALAFHVKWLVAAVVVLLVWSVIATVKRAPLIVLFERTLGRLFPSARTDELDVRGMRITQGMGAVLGAVALALLCLPDERAGWGFVLFYAILKTVSAIAGCPAYKLYRCWTGGSCCAFLRKAK